MPAGAAPPAAPPAPERAAKRKALFGRVERVSEPAGGVFAARLTRCRCSPPCAAHGAAVRLHRAQTPGAGRAVTLLFGAGDHPAGDPAGAPGATRLARVRAALLKARGAGRCARVTALEPRRAPGAPRRRLYCATAATCAHALPPPQQQQQHQHHKPSPPFTTSALALAASSFQGALVSCAGTIMAVNAARDELLLDGGALRVVCATQPPAARARDFLQRGARVVVRDARLCAPPAAGEPPVLALGAWSSVEPAPLPLPPLPPPHTHTSPTTTLFSPHQPLPALNQMGAAAAPLLLAAHAALRQTLTGLGACSADSAGRHAWRMTKKVFGAQLAQGGAWRVGGETNENTTPSAAGWASALEDEEVAHARSLAALEHTSAPFPAVPTSLAEVAHTAATQAAARWGAPSPDPPSGSALLSMRGAFAHDAAGRVRAALAPAAALVVARLVRMPADGCLGLDDGRDVMRLHLTATGSSSAAGSSAAAARPRVGDLYALAAFDVLVEAAQSFPPPAHFTPRFAAPVALARADALRRVAAFEGAPAPLAWARAPLTLLAVVVGHAAVEPEAVLHNSAPAAETRVHAHASVVLLPLELRPGGGNGASAAAARAVAEADGSAEVLALSALALHDGDTDTAVVTANGAAAALLRALSEGALVALPLDERAAGRWARSGDERLLPGGRLCHLHDGSWLPCEVALRAAGQRAKPSPNPSPSAAVALEVADAQLQPALAAVRRARLQAARGEPAFEHTPGASGLVRGVVLRKELRAGLAGSAAGSRPRHPTVLAVRDAASGRRVEVHVSPNAARELPPGVAEGAEVSVAVRASAGGGRVSALSGGVRLVQPAPAAGGPSVAPSAPLAPTPPTPLARLARLAAPARAPVRCRVAALRSLAVSVPPLPLGGGDDAAPRLRCKATALLDDGSACVEMALEGDDAWRLLGVGDEARCARKAIEWLAQQSGGVFATWPSHVRDARAANVTTAGGALGGAQRGALVRAAMLAAGAGDVAATAVLAPARAARPLATAVEALGGSAARARVARANLQRLRARLLHRAQR